MKGDDKYPWVLTQPKSLMLLQSGKQRKKETNRQPLSLGWDRCDGRGRKGEGWEPAADISDAYITDQAGNLKH